MPPKIALAVIAKDEKDELVRIIKDYGRFFDSVHIAYDGIVSELIHYLDFKSVNVGNVKIHQYLWINDFADKRNFLASKIDDADYYVRLDTDDILVGAENIRELVALAEHHNVVLCYYRYGADGAGNTDLAHYRETIVKLDDAIYWKKPVHENIVCDDHTMLKAMRDERHMVTVTHMRTRADRDKSVQRNLMILEAEFERDGELTDPRTIAYLGRTYTELGKFEKAVEFLTNHILRSGWDEDRYLSYLYLAEALFPMGKEKEALRSLYTAIDERPDFPGAYAKLCEVYFNRGNFHKAIDFGLIAISKDIPDTNLCFDPSLTIIKVPITLVMAYVHIGEYKKAISLFRSVEKIACESEIVKETKPTIDEIAEHMDYMDAFLKVLNFTKRHDKSKLESLASSIPQCAEAHQMMNDIKTHYLPPKVWSDNSVVIYCGVTPDSWSPQDVESGIGGSEEAVIHLSRCLSNLGYEVTVYSTIDSEYQDGLVKYVPYAKFSRNDKFATLIGWRQNIACFGVDAKRHIVWIHDMPRKEMLTADRIKNVDTIVVLSEYHKGLLPEHAKSKAYVSTNGINPSDFDGVKSLKQDARIIYASSYDRGLETIVENWSKIKEAVPHARLDVFYGWNTYDSYVRNGLCDNSFKTYMIKMFDQPDIFEHGRVGHKQLVEEYAKSAVWAYPCKYEGEINCIALTKAIACGCNIVTNKFAVMGERSPNAVDDDSFIDTLIETLKKPTYDKIDHQYIEENSWETVAADWHKNILKGGSL